MKSTMGDESSETHFQHPVCQNSKSDHMLLVHGAVQHDIKSLSYCTCTLKDWRLRGVI
jgi:hypothetical protein